MGFLAFLFSGKQEKINTFIKREAVLLDVRTLKEFNNGHIEHSLHIPLNELKDRLSEIQQHNKPVIAYCESGMRSATATKFLLNNAVEAINGGGWKRLKAQVETIKS